MLDEILFLLKFICKFGDSIKIYNFSNLSFEHVQTREDFLTLNFLSNAEYT